MFETIEREWYIDSTNISLFNLHYLIYYCYYFIGIEWDSRTCDSAAGAGYLECIEYAFGNGCEWDTTTTAAAAAGY